MWLLKGRWLWGSEMAVLGTNQPMDSRMLGTHYYWEKPWDRLSNQTTKEKYLPAVLLFYALLCTYIVKLISILTGRIFVHR